jgi:hypothetical protein
VTDTAPGAEAAEASVTDTAPGAEAAEASVKDAAPGAEAAEASVKDAAPGAENFICPGDLVIAVGNEPVYSTHSAMRGIHKALHGGGRPKKQEDMKDPIVVTVLRPKIILREGDVLLTINGLEVEGKANGLMALKRLNGLAVLTIHRGGRVYHTWIWKPGKLHGVALDTHQFKEYGPPVVKSFQFARSVSYPTRVLTKDQEEKALEEEEGEDDGDEDGEAPAAAPAAAPAPSDPGEEQSAAEAPVASKTRTKKLNAEEEELLETMAAIRKAASRLYILSIVLFLCTFPCCFGFCAASSVRKQTNAEKMAKVRDQKLSRSILTAVFSALVATSALLAGVSLLITVGGSGIPALLATAPFVAHTIFASLLAHHLRRLPESGAAQRIQASIDRKRASNMKAGAPPPTPPSSPPEEGSQPPEEGSQPPEEGSQPPESVLVDVGEETEAQPEGAGTATPQKKYSGGSTLTSPAKKDGARKEGWQERMQRMAGADSSQEVTLQITQRNLDKEGKATGMDKVYSSTVRLVLKKSGEGVAVEGRLLNQRFVCRDSGKFLGRVLWYVSLFKLLVFYVTICGLLMITSDKGYKVAMTMLSVPISLKQGILFIASVMKTRKQTLLLKQLKKLEYFSKKDGKKKVSRLMNISKLLVKSHGEVAPYLSAKKFIELFAHPAALSAKSSEDVVVPSTDGSVAPLHVKKPDHRLGWTASPEILLKAMVTAANQRYHRDVVTMHDGVKIGRWIEEALLPKEKDKKVRHKVRDAAKLMGGKAKLGKKADSPGSNSALAKV